ncbi:MAG: acetamidase/formamidase family protein, partial [Bacillota bacterium]
VQKFEFREMPKDRGHALCGPVAVRGAAPGMTLVLRFDEIRPGPWGWSVGGGGPWHLNERLGISDPPELNMAWELDSQSLTGVNQFGHHVKLRPFMGNVGMPPDEPGFHSTFPPRAWGGNLDCKELVAGSTLFLPIPVEGALLFVGDGHAVQGDGEVAGPALECPMEVVDITIDLRDDMPLRMPRAHTPVGWIAFGLHEDLDEAVVIAMNGMLDLMTELFNYNRKEALALANLVVDLRITQVVNGVRGVHAVLPHGAVFGKT